MVQSLVNPRVSFGQLLSSVQLSGAEDIRKVYSVSEHGEDLASILIYTCLLSDP